MKNIFLFPFLLFLYGCQTLLPIVSNDIHSESKKFECPRNVSPIELADIDYLLYVNKMIDSMISANSVQKEASNNRLRIYLSPITYPSDVTNMSALNTSIYNRIQRSGMFIIVDNVKNSEFILSGDFIIINESNSCNKKYEEFSLDLKKLPMNTILWSDKKIFDTL